MALGSLSLIISISGCSLVPTVPTPIHESERGTVALRTFSDQNFQTAHPKVLEPTLMVRVLQGLHVQEQKGTLATLMTGGVTTGASFFSRSN